MRGQLFHLHPRNVTDPRGLGLLDEYFLGLNPIVSDPGPDYLPIRLSVGDSGKVNNGNNCAVCHTTEMRVKDYRLFSREHGVLEEKVFYFRKGTNYPVSLNELVLNLPRPNSSTGNPNTTAKYYAQFLGSKTNLPAQFFLTDPQSRLGSNKVWATT